MISRAYYNEFDPKAAAGLRALIADGLIPAGEVDTRSITDVRATDLKGFVQCHFFAGIGGWSRALDLALWPHDRPVWTGSCPCQPFSSAGKQKGGADHRDLWPVWFGLIRECRPAIIFGEQVASAISHGWLDRMYSDMETEGYACGSAVLPACAVNAPHKRDRLWFVADSYGEGWRNRRISGGRPESNDGRETPERCHGGACVKGLCSCSISMANSSQCGRRQGRSGTGRISEESREIQKRYRPADSNGNVAYANSMREQYSSDEPGKEVLEIDGACESPLGDSQHEGSQGHCGHDGTAERREGQARSASETGFWDDADWIICADGKARRIPAAQSGIRILAHGVPERVGLLRAGGNAIVPEEAARFIKASEEAIR